ncbi:MAG: T9SS type A sorting domain-containing protein [Bacteroidales bacterium]|nr:T9SS type A sorting domain-containing protein [Bacteroidales bacterium]
MKQKYSILLTALLTVFSLQTIAQKSEVVFTYDASGNRITRTIILEEKKKEPKQEIDTTNLKQTEKKDNEIVKHTTTIGEMTINIYPNPNGGMFKVSIDGWDNKTTTLLQLHTLSGTEIVKKEHLQPETPVNISDQPEGTYILTLIINGKKEVWKLVKR